MAAKKSGVMSKKVVVVKVGLIDHPDIWRRIAIREDQTLIDLHDAIFDAFEREEEHLFSFYLPQKKPREKDRISPSALRTAIEYACPYVLEYPLFKDVANELTKSAEAKIKDLNLQRGSILYYLFDFGDEWWHHITVEAVDQPAERGKYPRIIEKHGQSPPQYPDDD